MSSKETTCSRTGRGRQWCEEGADNGNGNKDKLEDALLVRRVTYSD
jgi:hypothetical protein